MSSSVRLRSSHRVMNPHRTSTTTTIIRLISMEKTIIAFFSFLVGAMMTTMVLGTFHHGTTTTTATCACPTASPLTPPTTTTTGARRIETTARDEKQIEEMVKKRLNQATVRRYALGMARATKNDFVQEIDMGVPIDVAIKPGQEEVLLLYSHPQALPDIMQTRKQNYKKGNSVNNIIDNSNENHSDTSVPPLLDTHSAVANCDYLNIILTDNTGLRRQCMAIVPQYESYHVQKWMRVLRDKQGNVRDALDPKLNLTLVSRGYEYNGHQNFRPPRLEVNTKLHWAFLKTYFDVMDGIVDQLRPICKAIASRRRTIIVMVCNHGQSELLMNFVCAAKQRKLAISNVIVFATDEPTLTLARGMGLTAFYDERIFGAMPSEEAQSYGDMKFTKMMMAKVICVHLISMLGYNILFQDVDMIWYKHPLTYFEGASQSKSYFDMYFQDDGGHSVRYAPLSANSGFYYIRFNEKTQYFMNALLMAGDLVARTKSHQQAMIALLNEHSSLFGLRVKVLSRDETDFPGGYHYHQKSGRFMRDLFAGKVHPYIFHMSWTLNKANKVLFFRQMGEWYLQNTCLGKTVEDIFAAAALPDTNGTGSLVQPCCATEPLITCHYRDKPSKIPCKDSPALDNNKASFW